MRTVPIGFTRSRSGEATAIGPASPAGRAPASWSTIADLAVVVPAYNEEEVIGATIAALLDRGPQVIVVDDGSVDRTSERARRPGVTVLRHPINLGQGAAIRTGLDVAIDRGARYVATFDADGQHDPEDLVRMWSALVDAQADVALGSRFLGSASRMPRGRRVLVRSAARLTRLTTGLPLTDAHNGLRVMTAGAARRMRLRQRGMAHASEIVSQIRTLGLRVIEVPVHVRYTDYSLRKGQKTGHALYVLRELVSNWISRW